MGEANGEGLREALGEGRSGFTPPVGLSQCKPPRGSSIFHHSTGAAFHICIQITSSFFSDRFKPQKFYSRVASFKG